ncbi:hypothetical protein CBR_g38937 [Chara braunii]|uniref:Transposase MuDR plant domain-containing protein n=1 Tax=Chara braunii TaxID=69332 RepID=A0A388K0T1_CHABU|nr:hypothetical protein CBR_g38937 [Chara braunii]|eukprot:GBG63626.1 hypothetical protein CBR_g38937 [Chara braunii]
MDGGTTDEGGGIMQQAHHVPQQIPFMGIAANMGMSNIVSPPPHMGSVGGLEDSATMAHVIRQLMTKVASLEEQLTAYQRQQAALPAGGAAVLGGCEQISACQRQQAALPPGAAAVLGDCEPIPSPQTAPPMKDRGDASGVVHLDGRQYMEEDIARMHTGLRFMRGLPPFCPQGSANDAITPSPATACLGHSGEAEGDARAIRKCVGGGTLVPLVAEDDKFYTDKANDAPNEEQPLPPRDLAHMTAVVDRDLVLHMGQQFKDMNAFRATLVRYAVAGNFEFVAKKSERSRFRAICTTPGCDWYISARVYCDREGAPVCVNVHRPHSESCTGITNAKLRNYHVGYKWVAGIIEGMVRENPTVTPQDIRADVHRATSQSITYDMAHTALEYALLKIRGESTAGFKRLRPDGQDGISGLPRRKRGRPCKVRPDGSRPPTRQRVRRPSHVRGDNPSHGDHGAPSLLLGNNIPNDLSREHGPSGKEGPGCVGSVGWPGVPHAARPSSDNLGGAGNGGGQVGDGGPTCSLLSHSTIAGSHLQGSVTGPASEIAGGKTHGQAGGQPTVARTHNQLTGAQAAREGRRGGGRPRRAVPQPLSRPGDELRSSAQALQSTTSIHGEAAQQDPLGEEEGVYAGREGLEGRSAVVQDACRGAHVLDHVGIAGEQAGSGAQAARRRRPGGGRPRRVLPEHLRRLGYRRRSSAKAIRSDTSIHGEPPRQDRLGKEGVCVGREDLGSGSGSAAVQDARCGAHNLTASANVGDGGEQTGSHSGVLCPGITAGGGRVCPSLSQSIFTESPVQDKAGWPAPHVMGGDACGHADARPAPAWTGAQTSREELHRGRPRRMLPEHLRRLADAIEDVFCGVAFQDSGGGGGATAGGIIRSVFAGCEGGDVADIVCGINNDEVGPDSNADGRAGTTCPSLSQSIIAESHAQDEARQPAPHIVGAETCGPADCHPTPAWTGAQMAREDQHEGCPIGVLPEHLRRFAGATGSSVQDIPSTDTDFRAADAIEDVFCGVTFQEDTGDGAGAPRGIITPKFAACEGGGIADIVCGIANGEVRPDSNADGRADKEVGVMAVDQRDGGGQRIPMGGPVLHEVSRRGRPRKGRPRKLAPTPPAPVSDARGAPIGSPQNGHDSDREQTCILVQGNDFCTPSIDGRPRRAGRCQRPLTADRPSMSQFLYYM